MKRPILVLLLMMFLSVAAQAITVKGTVLDAINEPLPGVSVQVVGSQRGATTDYDGNYQISDVNPDATLRFSFIGTKTVEVKAVSYTHLTLPTT